MPDTKVLLPVSSQVARVVAGLEVGVARPSTISIDMSNAALWRVEQEFS